MNAYRAAMNEPSGPSQLVGVTILVGVMHLLSVWLLGFSAAPHLVLLPLIVAFGPLAVGGVALGGLFAEVVLGGIGVYALIRLLELIVMGVVATELWFTLPGRDRNRIGRAALLSIPVAFVAGLFGLGTTLLLRVVVAGDGAATVLMALLLDRVVLVMLGAPLLVLVSHRWTPPVDGRTTGRGRWVLFCALFGITGAGWVLATALFDLVHRDVAAVPIIADLIIEPLPPGIDALADMALQPTGWVFLLLGSAILLGVASLLWLRWGPEHNRSSHV